MNLPDLTGTTAQIAYADDIRGRVIDMLQVASELSGADTEATIGNVIARYTSAKWWIENQPDEDIRDFFLNEIGENARQEESIPTNYRLIIFDYNGTLVNVPFADHKPLHVLPGVAEVLAAIKELEPATMFGCAINAGGVARGYTTEAQFRQEVKGVLDPLHIDITQISFGYPYPKAGLERYKTPEMLASRKPSPVIPNTIMKLSGYTKEETLMVGDSPDEDRECARNTGIAFVFADQFFPGMYQHFFDKPIPKE